MLQSAIRLKSAPAQRPMSEIVNDAVMSSNSSEQNMQQRTANVRQCRARAMFRPGVKMAYFALAQELSLLDEVLKSRTIGVLATDMSRGYSFSHDDKV